MLVRAHGVVGHHEDIGGGSWWPGKLDEKEDSR